MRSAVQVYALTVCFFTLMCFVVALGVGAYDVVQIAAPRFTMAWFGMYDSNAEFVAVYTDKKDLPEEEITRARKAMLEAGIDAERRSALQSLVFVAILLVIDAAVYAAHWGIVRRERLLRSPA